MRNVDAQNKFSNSRCCVVTLKQSLEDQLAISVPPSRRLVAMSLLTLRTIWLRSTGRNSQLLRGVGLHRRAARHHQRREWQPHPDTAWFRKGSSVDSARARCFSEGRHAGGLEHMELRCLCWVRPLLNSHKRECFPSETSEVTAEPPVLWLHSQSEGRGARWTSCATSTPRTSSALSPLSPTPPATSRR